MRARVSAGDKSQDMASFRERGKQMVDYIADYLETIEQRRVLPEVQPGYLRDMLPNNAPTHAERWQDIIADVEHAIMPGVRLPTTECFSKPFEK